MYTLLLATAAPLATALPGGAPGCDFQAVNNMGGDNNPLLGWTMQPESDTYTPGQPMTITFLSPGNPDLGTTENAMAGILVYASPQSDPALRVGSWEFGAKWQSNADNCNANGITCLTDTCAVTHTSDDSKGSPDAPVAFTFTPPTDLDPNEPLVFDCAVAHSRLLYQTLESLTLMPSAGVGGVLEDPLPPAVAGNTDCQCQPVKKCKKWRNGGGGVAAADYQPPAAPFDTVPQDPSEDIFASQQASPSTPSDDEDDGQPPDLAIRAQQLSTSTPAPRSAHPTPVLIALLVTLL